MRYKGVYVRPVNVPQNFADEERNSVSLRVLRLPFHVTPVDAVPLSQLLLDVWGIFVVPKAPEEFPEAHGLPALRHHEAFQEAPPRQFLADENGVGFCNVRRLGHAPEAVPLYVQAAIPAGYPVPEPCKGGFYRLLFGLLPRADCGEVFPGFIVFESHQVAGAARPLEHGKRKAFHIPNPCERH